MTKLIFPNTQTSSQRRPVINLDVVVKVYQMIQAWSPKDTKVFTKVQTEKTDGPKCQDLLSSAARQGRRDL
ncbi:hypothetical protein KOW79_002123 [Hemibagrus wyckioides]|uniref:Uncharacterized protein n=1 Tax=Hemibagrus wyckioides TaxID=337641 RepID=A0A9D3P348_9TELE|nr:hypothetical protein KOW79_002123 [Hemibagrus wyckioides]